MASKRSAVIAFGRFNPPTSGHTILFDHATSSARRLGADLIVYPSVSHDARSNPLPFNVKVKFLQQLFPHIIFNTNSQIRSPFDAFKDIAARGYHELYVVMGGDERISDFQAFGKYFKRPTERGFDPTKHIPMGYQVLGIPRRNEKTVSGTAQRQRAAQNDFPSFLRGSADPKRPDIIRNLFAAVRQGMNVHESHTLRAAVAQHSFRLPLVEQMSPLNPQSPILSTGSRVDESITEATNTDRLRGAMMFYQTITYGKMPPHNLHTPEDIVNAALQTFTPTTRLTTNQWRIAGDMLRKMDQLGIRWNKTALRPMVKHAMKYESVKVPAITEAEGGGKVKAPSEIDRMRIRHTQEKIELQRRQGTEMQAAKLRDVESKAQEQQRKASAPKK